MSTTYLRIFVPLLFVLAARLSVAQDWVVYLEDDAVKIEYSSMNVFDDTLVGEQILFRFTNKLPKTMKLQYVRKVKYTGSRDKIVKKKFKIVLEPNQVKGAQIESKFDENGCCKLFVGWSHLSESIESFRIEKVKYSLIEK